MRIRHAKRLDGKPVSVHMDGRIAWTLFNTWFNTAGMCFKNRRRLLSHLFSLGGRRELNWCVNKTTEGFYRNSARTVGVKIPRYTPAIKRTAGRMLPVRFLLSFPTSADTPHCTSAAKKRKKIDRLPWKLPLSYGLNHRFYPALSAISSRFSSGPSIWANIDYIQHPLVHGGQMYIDVYKQLETQDLLAVILS